MNSRFRVVVVLAISTILIAATGCNQLKARDQLNKGVQAYKGGKFEQAINHFKNAVALDPRLINAKLYLATAYAQQYIPGVDSPENNRNAESAIEQYHEVLKQDANNVNSFKGIAYLYFQMKQFDKAKDYYKRVIEKDPNDPESYYSVAVIDWTQAYEPRMKARSEIGLDPKDPLKDKKVCEQLRAKNWDVVAEGMQMLETALQKRPDYDDAMAYLNLLYRERADIQCGDEAARKADTDAADMWANKTMETKRAKAEKEEQKQGGGIVLDQQPQKQ